MKDVLVVAVEGVSFSGKTTLCSAARGKDNFFVVAEPAAYAKGDFRQAKNLFDAKFNAFLTLEIEKTRAADARSSGKGVVLLDRSIYSLCALSYAYKTALGLDFFDDIRSSVVDALKCGQLLIPNFLVVLHENIDTLRARQRERGTEFMPYWLSPAFVNAQNEYYEKVERYYSRRELMLKTERVSPLDFLALAPRERLPLDEIIEIL